MSAKICTYQTLSGTIT